MTASEILNIVTTVGLSQLVCELLTKYFVYSGDDYKRKVAALERARWKLEKAEADAANMKSAYNVPRMILATRAPKFQGSTPPLDS